MAPNMAAESSEAVEAVANADLVNALNIVEDLIHRIDSLNDPDCVEGISLRLDVLKSSGVLALVYLGRPESILKVGAPFSPCNF